MASDRRTASASDHGVGPVLPAIADAARYPRPVWRSSRAYVLATIAGVVGLGNVWRFPYMAGRHGGGSFLVAYVTSVVVVAVPLAALESAAGGLRRRSPVGALRHGAGRFGAAVGWAIMAMTVAILSYYLVVTGWTLGYFVGALRGDVRVFGAFTDGLGSLWWFLLVGLLLLTVLFRGLAAVERSGLYVVPILIVMVTGLALYGLGLDGAEEARRFYFGVSGDALTDPATWRAAAGQAFYSMGVGQGLLIAYASFVPAGTNLVRSTAAIALTNSGVSIIAGMMVFAVTFTFGIAPTTGSELSFTAFPRVFAEVPGGAVLAVVFFGLLFLAGFTSCLGASVVISSTARDELRFGHRTAALVTVVLVVALGVPSALSFTEVGFDVGGRPLLDRVDQATGSGAIVVLGLIGAAQLARIRPRARLVAAFAADTVSIGPLRVGPRWLLVWASALPFVAAAGYLAMSVV